MRYEYMAFQRRTAQGGTLAIRALGATYPIALRSDAVLDLALVYDDIGGRTLDLVQYDCEDSNTRLLSDKSLVSLEEMVPHPLLPPISHLSSLLLVFSQLIKKTLGKMCTYNSNTPRSPPSGRSHL